MAPAFSCAAAAASGDSFAKVLAGLSEGAAAAPASAVTKASSPPLGARVEPSLPPRARVPYAAQEQGAEGATFRHNRSLRSQVMENLYFLESQGDPYSDQGQVGTAVAYAAVSLAIIDGDSSHMPDSWEVAFEELNPSEVLQNFFTLMDEIKSYAGK